MMRILTVAVALLLGACANTRQYSSGWAVATTADPDTWPRECNREHVLPEPPSGKRNATARYVDTVLDKYAELRHDYGVCSLWARRQRP